MVKGDSFLVAIVSVISEVNYGVLKYGVLSGLKYGVLRRVLRIKGI